MKSLPFKKLDAFAQGEAAGNPAGYIDMTGAVLAEAEMQRIASELKGFVSEVGFTVREGDSWRIRYFSSEREVAFCGHASVAILYDLLKQDPELGKREALTFFVRAGALKALNFIEAEDAVYIQAPAARYLELPVGEDAIRASLGLERKDREDTLPCALIDGGLRTLIVPVKGLETCLALSPRQEELRSFCLANGIDIIHVSSRETARADCGWRARVFAPAFGYLEDPATGSGNAAFGYYLLRQGLWNGPLCLEQGPSRQNPNRVRLRCLQEEGIPRIYFGGAATVRIEGRYLLHESSG